MAARDPDLVFYFPSAITTTPVVLSENGGWQNRADVKIITSDPELKNVIGKVQNIDYINHGLELRKLFTSFILKEGSICIEYQYQKAPLFVTEGNSAYRRITDATGAFFLSNGYVYVSVSDVNKQAVRALVYFNTN